jgi:gas vesicle protein
VIFHSVDVFSSNIEGVLFRWVALLATQGVLFAGVLFTWLSSRRQVGDVKDLAAPTGNGFAKEMKEAVKEIKETVTRVENKVDTHIQDHARSSFRDNQ